MVTRHDDDDAGEQAGGKEGGDFFLWGPKEKTLRARFLKKNWPKIDIAEKPTHVGKKKKTRNVTLKFFSHMRAKKKRYHKTQ